MSADRISGLVFLILGVMMLTIIIPEFVETAEGGVIQPATLPALLSWVMAGCGAWIVLRPARFDGHLRLPDRVGMRSAGLYAAVLGGGVLLMGELGFLPVAPGLALVIMLMIGERRWAWLGAGVVAVPAAIWAFALLLGRPLL